jgi:hypothetical protein
MRATSSSAVEKSGATTAVVSGGIVRAAHAARPANATTDTSE